MAKKETIRNFFNDIAPDYDRLNHLLSFHIDKIWRRKAIKALREEKIRDVLDVACGTGDFSIAAARAMDRLRITGVDIAGQMLDVGRIKVEKAGLAERISLQYGDCEDLHFETASFDAVTVAFGVRNFEHLQKGLREMHRVLRTGGKVVILEFSMPDRFPVKQLYRFYFRKWLPLLGGWISGNREAYTYLPESVINFPQGKEFLDIMQTCGFSRVGCKKLTFGIASLYTAVK